MTAALTLLAAIVGISLALYCAWTVIAACLACLLHGGRYRGQDMDAVEIIGTWAMSLVILCAAVVVLGVV